MYFIILSIMLFSNGYGYDVVVLRNDMLVVDTTCATISVETGCEQYFSKTFDRSLSLLQTYFSLLIWLLKESLYLLAQL
jgi:hypothetical protein